MKWEYKLTQLPSVQLGAQEKLNWYGRQGWELVSIVDGLAYLKRPGRLTLSKLKVVTDPMVLKGISGIVVDEVS